MEFQDILVLEHAWKCDQQKTAGWLVWGSDQEKVTSLVVEGLRLQAANAGDPGSIPGQETMIPHATWYSQKFKRGGEKQLSQKI